MTEGLSNLDVSRRALVDLKAIAAISDRIIKQLEMYFDENPDKMDGRSAVYQHYLAMTTEFNNNMLTIGLMADRVRQLEFA